MYCAYCGHTIPKEMEDKSEQIVGKGIESGGKTYTFHYRICHCCVEKINDYLKGGEEAALRREFEDKLFNEGGTQEEIESKMRDFDTKTFGKSEVFGK